MSCYLFLSPVPRNEAASCHCPSLVTLLEVPGVFFLSDEPVACGLWSFAYTCSPWPWRFSRCLNTGISPADSAQQSVVRTTTQLHIDTACPVARQCNDVLDFLSSFTLKFCTAFTKKCLKSVVCFLLEEVPDGEGEHTPKVQAGLSIEVRVTILLLTQATRLAIACP